MKHRVASVAVLASILAQSASGQQSLSLVQQQSLAQKFRPLIKTTLDEGRDEPFHPLSWKTFICESDLYSILYAPIVTAEQMCADNLELVLPTNNANVMVGDAAQHEQYLHLILNDTSSRAGASWQVVVHGTGQGIYAHVEPIPNTTFINIEYTILWAYNAAIGSNHDGDITSIELVYDTTSDLLIRIVYMMHGCVLEGFQIAHPESMGLRLISGLDENMNTHDLTVAKISVDGAHARQQSVSCNSYCVNGDCHSPSDRYVYLAQDPDSSIYRHPVIFAEEGSHEPWPNPSGSIWTVPAHTGNGVSFIPDTVETLGTPTQPNPVDYAFLFYNGKFGTDPAAILFHRAWFWPGGRANNPFSIPDDRFSDNPDPYDENQSLSWPPTPQFASAPATVFVDNAKAVAITANSGPDFDGSISSPFPDVLTAMSLSQVGSTISIETGSYPATIKLTRPSTLVARDGVVVLGRQ